MRAGFGHAVELESYANACSGKWYRLLQMTKRVDGRRPCQAFKSSTCGRKVMRQRGSVALSRPLVDAMHGRP